jgi:hypothetical protein
MNLIVKTPRETDVIANAPFKCPWTLFYEPRLHDLGPSYYYSNYSDYLDVERWDEPSSDTYFSYKDYAPSLQGHS